MATGHREGRLASLDPRMTSLGAMIGSGKFQNVNKAAATAAVCRGSWWLLMHGSAITGGMHACICFKSNACAKFLSFMCRMNYDVNLSCFVVTLTPYFTASLLLSEPLPV